MFGIFKKKQPPEPIKRVFTSEEFQAYMSVVCSPNGRFSWVRELDGTVKRIDNDTGKFSYIEETK